MKVSIVTVVYNAELYIRDCIESVMAQTHPNLEYIVIDGGSTDRTLEIIAPYRSFIQYFSSEKDKGIYDGMNKGIAVATGEVIGFLNADDMLASNDVVEQIVKTFENKEADAVFGHLNYVHPKETSKIIRQWKATPYQRNNLKFGWMPAHPTFYVKRSIFEKYGNFSLEFGTAADYELMLRFLYHYRIKAVLLNVLMVNMRAGGVSNADLSQRNHAMRNDYRAMIKNGIPFAFLTLLLKKLRKIPQFFAR